ncbi:MAG: hypothetical protein P4M08_01115, partial [Oligoflexia bacterium]|nr:hypothetical protein [Oligoflexia bacterium]
MACKVVPNPVASPSPNPQPSSTPIIGSGSGSSGSGSVTGNADYDRLDQCLTSTASVVGLSDTNITLSGGATVKGSVILLGNSELTMSGGSRVLDQVYTPRADQVMTSGKPSIGEIVVHDFTSADSAVIDFANNLDPLPETAVYKGITSSTTINGNGSLNVIQVNGDLSLSGGKTLSLNGGANDLFLINVTGNVTLSGGSSIAVGSTLPPANVLIRLTSAGSSIMISGGANAAGTFLATQGSATISGAGKIEGSIFALNSISISGAGMTFDPAPFCPANYVAVPSPTPSPSPSPTPTVTSSPSPTPTVTSSPSPTPTVTSSPSPTPTVTSSPSPTPTVTSSPSPTPTVTSSPSPTPTVTSSPSPTPTVTSSPSPTPTVTSS